MPDRMRPEDVWLLNVGDAIVVDSARGPVTTYVAAVRRDVVVVGNKMECEYAKHSGFGKWAIGFPHRDVIKRADTER